MNVEYKIILFFWNKNKKIKLKIVELNNDFEFFKNKYTKKRKIKLILWTFFNF